MPIGRRDVQLRVLAYAGVWLVCAVAGRRLVLFFSSTRTIELASHDAVVQPT